MKLEVREARREPRRHRQATAFGSFRLLQVVILGLTIAGVVIGWRISVPGGIAPVNAVAFGLTVVWALVGFVDGHARDRTGSTGVPVPPHGGGRRLRGDDRAHGRPPSRDRALHRQALATSPRSPPSR